LSQHLQVRLWAGCDTVIEEQSIAFVRANAAPIPGGHGNRQITAGRYMPFKIQGKSMYKTDVLQIDDIDGSIDLLRCSYSANRKEINQLPSLSTFMVEHIKKRIIKTIDNPSIAIYQDGSLQAFMHTIDFFQFKGQKAVLVSEYSHSAVEENKSKLYQIMYRDLAEQWAARKVQLHLIGHLTYDLSLQSTLFDLGYGAILAERVRNLELLQEDEHHNIRIVDDPKILIDLEAVHRKYYQRSPIFIWKSSDAIDIENDFSESKEQGDIFIVCFIDGKPIGYMMVGSVEPDSEMYLLQETNTAQIKSAFIDPNYRSKGIGSSLLNESIIWAKRKGFDRISVEHETANYYGGKFWAKHFTRYLNFSMRYVDKTVK
jgi:GNAT superfamily N-acetyltransferase